MKTFLSALLVLGFGELFCQRLPLHSEQDLGEFYKAVAQKTDSLFTDYGYTSPGSAVVIIHNGNIMLNKGYGLANLENEIAITPQTVFDLASISKMFTGYAIASLLSDKKLSLQDDLRKYIPEFPDYGHTITLGHLAHHTSGIKNWTEFMPVAGWSFDDVINAKQILNFTLRQKELDFIPGTKYEYCNTGYVLLAEVVHRVTGVTLNEWSQKNIFTPLAMTRTTILDDHTRIIPGKAHSYYTGSDGHYHLSPSTCSVPGSSSVHSSTEDLSKWLLFLDESGDKKKIIDLMYEPGTLSNGEKVEYGLGTILKTFKGASVKRHEGFWPSFSTYLFTVPEQHLSVAVLNNSRQQSYRELLEIVSMFLPRNDNETNPPVHTHNPGVEISPKKVQPLAGTYRGGPAWYLTISVAGSTITAQPTNDDPYEMIPLSDSVFYIPEFRDTITFVQNSAVQQHLRFKGKLLPRIQPNQVNTSQYKKLAGNYCSDELQTCYEIVMEGETVYLQHPHLGKFKLTPGFNFDFAIFGAERYFPAALEFVFEQNKRTYSLKLGSYLFGPPTTPRGLTPIPK